MKQYNTNSEALNMPEKEAPFGVKSHHVPSEIKRKTSGTKYFYRFAYGTIR